MTAPSSSVRWSTPTDRTAASSRSSFVDRNAGDQIDDVVTASVEDVFGQTGSASDDELVTVDDVAPDVVVEKQNIAVDGTNEIVAPGGLATYSIEIDEPRHRRRAVHDHVGRRHDLDHGVPGSIRP